MPRHEKFSKKSYLAFSSWNLTWEGVGSEEDASERRGFWDGVDLRLGAIEQTNARRRERERERDVEKHQSSLVSKDRNKMVRLHENAWTCDMQT